MRKAAVVTALALIALIGPSLAHADLNDKLLQVAYDTATLTQVSVTTNPALALSTGTNWPSESVSAQPFAVNRGTSNIKPTPGGFMPTRRQLEFFNDTGQDVWIGPHVNISSFTGDATRLYGRRIPHGASWSTDSRIRDSYYVVSGSTTRRAFGVWQQR